MPLGIAHDSPVGTLTMDLGGTVTVDELYVSYPMDPAVARVGNVALSDRSWNGTESASFFYRSTVNSLLK